MVKKTFVQKLIDMRCDAKSYIDPYVRGEIVEINGVAYLYRDIPKTEYGYILKAHLSSKE